MVLEKLDVKQMRLLLLLLQKRSLSKVALALNVSQQAISMQLKSLRMIFDDPLFVRDGQGMTPTAHALSLGDVIANVLSQLEQAAHPAQFLPEKVTATVVISATDYAQYTVTNRLFFRIRQLAPGIKLIVKELEIETLSTSMASGQLDLVVTTPAFLSDNLPYAPLFKETYQLVSSAKLPPKQLTHIQALNHYDHVIVSPSRANLTGSSQSWFEAQGVKRNIVAAIPHFSMLVDYVSNGDVLAYVPSKMLPNPGLREIHLPQQPPGFEVVVAWHPSRSQTPLHQWLVTQMQAITAAS
ncbi:LysR family transcriptional regulator [Thalassotalea euphylliae]|uniref:LysR family transcriptional regulator n=1 Tax=Thalassotalea euphylliae TaxID=1655234 RepID=UPI0011C0194A|nr:LysR family transcriptional regulator [Thalassotalea euphylliae]